MRWLDIKRGAGRMRPLVRRRIAAWSFALPAVFVVVFLSPSPAAAASACPNEQLRAENNSTQLPDCRAYELVTPVDKLGHAVVVAESPERGAVVSPDGLHVYFASNGAFGDQESGMGGAFQASRSAVGWLSTTVATIANVDHPGYSESEEFDPKGASPDLSTFFYKRNERGVIVGGHEEILHGTVYARYPGGAFADVSQNSTGQATYVGSSADGSHVILEMAPLVTVSNDGDTRGVESLSDSTAGHVFPVGVETDGSPTSTCGSILAGTSRELVEDYFVIRSPFLFGNAVSNDGSRVFFESPDPHGASLSSDPNCGGVAQLYVRQNNATTTEVSLSQKAGSVGTPAPGGAKFEGASADGSRVFFESHDQLTNDSAASEGGLYEYDLESGTLTFIAKEAEVLGNPNKETPAFHMPPQISNDGTHLYFFGSVPGNGPSGRNLYLWDNGRIAFIVRAGGLEIPLSETSADGSTLAFMTTASLGFASSGPEIYVYEASADTLACISCGSGGSTGPPQLYGIGVKAELFGTSNLAPVHSVTSDGSRVFFDSPASLVPAATNGLYNVYEYENGGLQLLSDGSGPYESRLAGASSNGNDVIIGTYDSLIPQDQGSNNGNLYDVRVDGGFPAPVTAVGCEGEACQGQTGVPPVLLSASSELYPAGEDLASPLVVKPVVKVKVLTRAQKRTKALKACRAKHNKHKRARCEAEARAKYGTGHKAKKTSRRRR